MADRQKPTPIRTSAGDVVVVHNGIIENYLRAQRATRRKRGTHFSSETDTEIVAHLVAEKSSAASISSKPCAAHCAKFAAPMPCYFLTGAIRGVLSWQNSTPIVIGWGEGEDFIASDIPALLDYTRKVTFLEDGEIGEVTLGSYRLLDGRAKPSSAR